MSNITQLGIIPMAFPITQYKTNYPLAWHCPHCGHITAEVVQEGVNRYRHFRTETLRSSKPLPNKKLCRAALKLLPGGRSVAEQLVATGQFAIPPPTQPLSVI